MRIRPSGSAPLRLPSVVVIEEGALEALPQVLAELDCRKLLVVSDENVWKLLGDRLSSTLRGEAEIHLAFAPGSDYPTLNRLRPIVTENNPCAVLGLGGGRPIDMAKYTAHLERKLFVSVPTVISHDGFASPIVALKDEQGNPVSTFTSPPHAVIVDLSVVASAPRRLLASGVGDILGKLTSVADARLAQREVGEKVSEAALEMALSAYRIVSSSIEKLSTWNLEGAKLLAEAGLLAGMAMAVAGSSRPCSGSEHLFSHALDKLYPGRRSLHGEQVGVGAVVSAYLHGLGWEELKRMLRAVGAPATVRELGVTPEQAAEALAVAPSLRDRYTILHKLRLSREEALRILRETGVS
ncbi:MAG: iron-containing alcohol dehydrogenase [Thermofilum sp.]